MITSTDVPILCLSAAFLTIAGGATAAELWPMPEWPRATPAEVGMNEAKLQQARDYALAGGGSGYITRHGKLVLSWGDPKQRYDLKSTTKSIGVTALGLALKDGKIKLVDKAAQHHPTFGVPPESNAQTGWLGEITILHLATQTAGFEKPGGYEPLIFKPGTKWHYSDGGPNWLAECITLIYGQDLNTLMFDRVFTPLGIAPEDLVWRNNSYRDHTINAIPGRGGTVARGLRPPPGSGGPAPVMRREFGSGISADVDAMARLGYLYLRGGRWQGREIIPRSFVDMARRPIAGVAGLPEQIEQRGNASEHYGFLWWNNGDGTLPEVPRDAYWSWGLHDSFIMVIPGLDIVVSRAGSDWKRQEGAAHYDVLKPFLGPIVGAVGRSQK